MEQWRAAAHALAQVRRDELAAMREEDSAAAACAIMEFPCPERCGEREEDAASGLVIQQAIFARARRR